MFSLFELVWKRIRLFFTDDEVFYIGGADVLPPPLEREQENRCLIALSGLHGDSEPMTREDARKQLIEHNLRLVVYLARKFENTGICVETNFFFRIFLEPMKISFTGIWRMRRRSCFSALRLIR